MTEKPRVLDLFAGAGGLSLGFEQAGAEIVAAIEADAWAAQTLQKNHLATRVLQRDISQIQDDEVVSLFSSARLSGIVGGPPCQGFSHSNINRHDAQDPRNSLFVHFARFVRILRPRFFLIENVPGLLRTALASGQQAIEVITDTFRALDYSVGYGVLRAESFGVPQIRERLFIVGTLDRQLPFLLPKPTHQDGIAEQFGLFGTSQLPSPVTLWEAISDLPPLSAGMGEDPAIYSSPAETEYQREMRQGALELHNHIAMRHSKRIVERFKAIAIGESQSDVNSTHAPRVRSNGSQVSEKRYDQNNRRQYPDRPCHTIPASFYANFIHPFQHRNFTAREGARLQSFPDTYIFLGKPTVVSHKLLAREGRVDEKFLCQYAQIGNAVPPKLAKAVAGNIFGANLMPTYVHGDNIAQKKAHATKYRDDQSVTYLAEIEKEYLVWKRTNEELKGNDEPTITKRVDLLNKYKDFVDQQRFAETFDSRSNLHSSVLEEFLLYLFRDSVPHSDLQPEIGKAQTFKAFYLAPKSFEDLLTKPPVLVETKDHDFIIGTCIKASFSNKQGENIAINSFAVPAVAIECKTYLDKTMLEGASISAEELKRINPSARYMIVAEWLKLTESVNLKKYKIDQIFVLRRQKNTDREFRFLPTYNKNPIYSDLVWELYKEVTDYLASRWDLDAAVARGKLL